MKGTKLYRKKRMKGTLVGLFCLGFFLGVSLGNLVGTTRGQSEVHFTVAYSSEKATWMGEIQGKFLSWWSAEHPGTTIKVEFHPYGSQDSLIGILTEEVKPVVWSPASSIWIPILNTRWQEQGEKFHGQSIIENVTRVIYSPVVIATWKSFEEEANLTGFNSLHNFIEANPGRVKLAHTDPRLSNSGFMTVIMEVSAYLGKAPRDITLDDLLDENLRDWMKVIEGAAVQYGKSTGFLANLMLNLGPGGMNVAVLYENLIREISPEYKGDKIVAVYPEEGTLYSDHPFCLLNASWVNEDQAFVAREFMRFIQQPDIVTLAMKAGFRPIDGSIPLDNETFNFATYGIKATFHSPELTIPSDGEVIQRIPDLWLITRPTG
ncbi:MAG: substrate-binding domain-containing protein [Promethearchaeota archaeon]